MSALVTAAQVPRFGQDRAVHGWLAVKGVSDAGDAAWTIALAWTAVQVASPALAGLVVAAGTLPRAFVLLVGGVIADRFETLRVLRWVTVARVVILLAAVVTASLVEASVLLLLAVAVGFGLCDAVFEPAAATLGRQLVRKDDIGAYTGAAQTASRLGTMAGAAIGGGLVAVGGLAASALANAVTYGLVLFYLLVGLAARFPLPRSTGEPVLRSIASGFAHLRDEPATRVLVLTLSGLNLAVGPALGLGLALRVQQAAWGAGTLGLLQALVGLGAVVGAVVLVRWRPPLEWRVTFGLLVLQGFVVGLLAVPALATAVVACLVIGVTAGAASALLSAVFLRTVAPDFLGRLASMQRMGDDVLMPAAMAAFGALAAGAGIEAAFVVFGGVMASLMLVTMVSTWSTVPRGPDPAVTLGSH